MNVRLYFDEDAMDRRLVDSLRARGADVVVANEVGMIDRDDAEHLAWAATDHRAIYTFNVGDFCKLHAEWTASGRDHSGIIAAQQQVYSVGDQMRRLLKLITTLTADEMQNRIEFLGAWS